jgi:hypothetical protein
MSARIAHYIRRHHIALLALFIALSGTAYAVDGPLPGQNQVGSEDILNGEVRNPDLGTDAVASGKIADRQVKNADLSLGASSSNTIADGGIQGVDVKSNALTGAQIDEPTLFNDNSLTGADIDESSLAGIDAATLDGNASSAFPRTFARADDSFAPGVANRLELNVGLGALVAVLCDDGGTPGNDSDDAVSIGVVNLNPDPFQITTERSNAPGNGSNVNSHSLTRFVLGQFNSTTSVPAPLTTHRFYMAPTGESQTTIIAEATGIALNGSDDCASVVQATRSN